jgi:hypothetical protein
MEISELPFETRDLITSELKAGEKLLWLQRPNTTRILIASVPVALFGIPWTAFSIAWIYLAASKTGDANLPFPAAVIPLFGLPFVLAGIGILSLPYVMWTRAKKSVYVLSNKRAIFMNKGRNAYEIISYTKEQLADMKKYLRSDGSGDLIFEEIRKGRNRTVKPIGFLGIKNVNEVEDIIKTKVMG